MRQIDDDSRAKHVVMNHGLRILFHQSHVFSGHGVKYQMLVVLMHHTLHRVPPRHVQRSCTHRHVTRADLAHLAFHLKDATFRLVDEHKCGRFERDKLAAQLRPILPTASVTGTVRLRT